MARGRRVTVRELAAAEAKSKTSVADKLAIADNLAPAVWEQAGAADLQEANTLSFRDLHGEMAPEHLQHAPMAGPHSADTAVRLNLVDAATRETVSFEYEIPAEFQPNHHLHGQGVFYRI